MFRQVKPKADFIDNENWKNDFNMDDDRALSMYDVSETKTCRNGRVKGTIRVAFWSKDAKNAPAELYYNRKDKATVKDLQCAEPQDGKSISMHVGNDRDRWGTVLPCDYGPTLYMTGGDNDTGAPPTLILNRSDGDTFLIVEESSNYPSFLYSVWKNETQHHDVIELTHVFYIGATVRLAEAVVTAIVHGKTSGRECFMLVRENSDNDNQNENGEEGDTSSSPRATPFGEDPTNDLVEIEDLETLECGLKLDLKALICLVYLTFLTTAGITWSFCLRSSIGMNVYDRDELIRAVSMSVAAERSPTPSAIRIFVRKEDSGRLSVVISDTGDAENGCRRIFRRGGQVVEAVEPALKAAHVAQFNIGYGGAAIPVGRSTMWPDGVQTGKGGRLPGRNRDFFYPTSVALSASPVPSPACSLVATPVYRRSALGRIPRDGPRLTGGRDASVLFDRTLSPSFSDEDEPESMQVGNRSNVERGDALSARVVASGNPRDASGMLQGVHPPDMEGPILSNRHVGTNMWPISSRRMPPQANEVSSPAPPILRVFSLGPPQLDPLSRGSGDETKEHTYVIRVENIDGVKNERCSPYFEENFGKE